MKKNLPDIDKLFKTAIDDHKEEPSSSVWEAIANDLDKSSLIDINRKYIRLKRIAIALLIFLLGAGVYTLSTLESAGDEASNNPTFKKEQNHQNNKDNSIVSGNKADQMQAPVVQSGEGTNVETSNIPADQHQKNKLQGAAIISEGQGALNSTLQVGKEIKGTTGGRNVILNKKAQNTRITNGEYGEEDGETDNVSTFTKENRFDKNVSALTAINPETIKAGSSRIFGQTQVLSNKFLRAQLNESKTNNNLLGIKNAGRFTITAFYAPNISVNHFKDDDNKTPGGRVVDDRDQIKKGEHFQYSTTFGALLDYKLAKHWSLQSGVSVSSKTIHINPKTIYAGIDDDGAVKYLYNCSSGYLYLSSKSVASPVVGDSIQAFESVNFLQYVSVPLVLKYNYAIKRFNLFVSTGVSLNMLTKNKIETGISNGQMKEVSINNKINGLQTRYFGVSVGMGASYCVSDKIAISFLPSYNFAITSLTKGATVKTYPDTIGFGAGLTFKL